jgi:predicted DNA-binding protein (MmcQ/YjbR family)
MNYTQFNAFCAALPHTTYVMQWGGSHVWKIGGKVFAIGGQGNNNTPAYTFKTSELSFEMLKDQQGLRPAPYLAARGLKWIQKYADFGLTDDELKLYIQQSYIVVSQGLTKKMQRELGIIA